MKILFITNESFIDHSFTMIRELKKHAELRSIIIAKERTPEINDFCSRLGADFFKRVRFLNPMNLFIEFRLMKAIKKLKADLVWFNTLTLGQVILIKLFVRRFLVSTHDVETHPEDEDYYYLISKKITLRLFKKHIAVMSSSQAELFYKHYGIKPYLLQLPIIDYYEAVSGNILIPSESSSKIRFLFFGSIQPYKGIELLIDAAEILNSKGADFKLNILGCLRYNNESLSARMAGIKNVNYKNTHIDYKDVFSLYSQNDIIIIPYKHVTQSGPLLIGYSRNMPCITSDLPGFREYVDDGKSGMLFNNTAEALAEKMKDFIDNRNKIESMSDYIFKELKQRFSMSSLAGAYIDVFRSMLS